ncbi:hypothetical protein Glove_21g164 [Diversispora epigaea]|uniref:Uncharacterized protein n=1 Tax=Diversispora epigaea TaxID=1348612 RepID=A0A397JUA9_9GLOM|nr:hypothetical protein Glove_21g164 [Diversispora epigaea]
MPSQQQMASLTNSHATKMTTTTPDIAFSKSSTTTAFATATTFIIINLFKLPQQPQQHSFLQQSPQSQYNTRSVGNTGLPPQQRQRRNLTDSSTIILTNHITTTKYHTHTNTTSTLPNSNTTQNRKHNSLPTTKSNGDVDYMKVSRQSTSEILNHHFIAFQQQQLQRKSTQQQQQ